FIGCVARLDHCLERLAFVLYVSLRGLHQVRNQVVAACELHVDLSEGVLEGVACRDQAVVGGNENDHGRDDDQQNYPDHETPDQEWTAPGATPLRALNPGLEEVQSGLVRSCRPHVQSYRECQLCQCRQALTESTGRRSSRPYSIYKESNDRARHDNDCARRGHAATST